MRAFAPPDLDAPYTGFEPRTAIRRFAASFLWLGAVIAVIAGAIHRARRTASNRSGAHCTSEAAR